MRRAICAYQTGAVYHKCDGKGIPADVDHHLVVGPLEKGRIDRYIGFHAARSHASRHRDGVFFCDADVEEAVGMRLGKLFKPVPVGIAAVIAHMRMSISAISASWLAAMGPHGGMCSPRFTAGVDEERCHAVILVRMVLGRLVAVPLLRHHVHQHRSVGIFRPAQDANEVL